MIIFIVTDGAGNILKTGSSTNQELAVIQVDSGQDLFVCPEVASPQIDNTAYIISGGVIVANNPGVENQFDGLAVEAVVME